MKRLIAVLALSLCAAVPSLAQSDTPKADIFGGYAYGSIDADVAGRQGAHGGGFSVTGNFSKALGITGEYAYGRGKISTRINNFNLNTNFATHLFLAGPRIHARGEKGTFFGHALAGVAKTSVDVSVPGLNLAVTDTNFAMGIGAGADYNVSKNFAIRVFQADYIPVKVSGAWAHNFRFMAGVVFRVGN